MLQKAKDFIWKWTKLKLCWPAMRRMNWMLDSYKRHEWKVVQLWEAWIEFWPSTRSMNWNLAIYEKHELKVGQVREAWIGNKLMFLRCQLPAPGFFMLLDFLCSWMVLIQFECILRKYCSRRKEKGWDLVDTWSCMRRTQKITKYRSTKILH